MQNIFIQEHVHELCKHMNMYEIHTYAHIHIHVHKAVYPHPACFLHAVYPHIECSPCLIGLLSLSPLPGPWVSKPSANTCDNLLSDTKQALRGAALSPSAICFLKQVWAIRPQASMGGLRNQTEALKMSRGAGLCLHASALVGPTPLLMGWSHSLASNNCQVRLRDSLNRGSYHSTTTG